MSFSWQGKDPPLQSTPVNATENANRAARLAKSAWALALAAVFLAWAAHALQPLARLWPLSQISQAGQLTVFNRSDGGGQFGMPVELGDFDGDGNPDLVVAPMGAPGSGRLLAGEVYVYKGDGSIDGVIDRAGMPIGSPSGLTVTGARQGDFLGTEVFTADVTGDGIDDLIIGIQNYDGLAGDRDNCGGVVVVPGRPGLLDGSLKIDVAAADLGPGVFRVIGRRPGDRLGVWVEAGDLDGDGISDLLLGADQDPADDANERFHTGSVFVIYGRQTFPMVIDLSTDVATFPGISWISGRDPEDHFGASLHSRDLNSDGSDELIVGAALSRLSASQDGGSGFFAHSSGGGDGPDNTRPDTGDVTVFFTRKDERLPGRIDLSSPLPPALQGRVTTIHGYAEGDLCGEEITTGDYNGDGLPDLALGALLATSPSEPRFAVAGAAHVIYWKPGLEGTTIDLAPGGSRPEGLAVSNMHGIQEFAILGDTLSTGDFNHDGFDDLAIGIPHAHVNGQIRAGIVAIAFGRSEPWPELWAPEDSELPPGLQLAYVLGIQSNDLMSYSMEARDFDRDGYADLFPNAMRGDGSAEQAPNAGEAYLVSGFHLTQGAEAKPSIASVDPSSATVGAPVPVTILGSAFTTSTDTRVLVDDVEATDVRVLTGGRIEAIFPARATGGLANVRVENRFGAGDSPNAFEYRRPFIRGDATGDADLNIADPVYTLNGLFQGGEIACFDAADANDDATVDISDPVRVLLYLFLGGEPPPPPFPAPGLDTTPDELGCP